MARRGARSDRNIETRKKKARRAAPRPKARAQGNSANGRRRLRKQALIKAGRPAEAAAS